ncbi:hypothetical protein R6Z07F_003756 [Ovis aries]
MYPPQSRRGPPPPRAKEATGCSAAPRPRGGSVGLALAPPGAAETSQPLAQGSETFPLARRWRLASCPLRKLSAPDRGPGPRGTLPTPSPNDSFSFFVVKEKICLSLQQRGQPRALEMESRVQSTGAGVGVSGPPRAGGGDPAGGHAGFRSPACRGPLRSSPPPRHAPPRIPSARIVLLPRSPPPAFHFFLPSPRSRHRRGLGSPASDSCTQDSFRKGPSAGLNANIWRTAVEGAKALLCEEVLRRSEFLHGAERWEGLDFSRGSS